ncbi:hydroxyethylthiazole kinase [Enterococcus sp. DIV1298c]|uniref:hydroxyethylthiazole kinase n=1 Tax=Enterococcus sp. DIV1298c TaxID=2815328 RepID=UPI001A90D389|nr:hydroxyethylthiazole kinase [Enterococcus sp. DIV1298c]MBO0462597.1 hydroxyethylthiazole kinase [Enterococcus sp. DIV1298c]
MNTFLETAVETVRTNNPLVHHITNYVTVNDCANLTLAIGGSPIMADEVLEVMEITGMSQALVLNMGTLNERTVNSMLLAGQTANKKGIPIIFDPVGAGASDFRNETARSIINMLNCAVIRGNISEIRFLAGITSSTKGVDASASDTSSIEEAQLIADQLATAHECIVVITGAVDVISDGRRNILVHNGCAEMSRITGTGCMLTSLIGSFCGSFPDQLFYAATTAVLAMGIAGELAFEQTTGTGSFRVALIDEISRIDQQTLTQRGNYVEK